MRDSKFRTRTLTRTSRNGWGSKVPHSATSTDEEQTTKNLWWCCWCWGCYCFHWNIHPATHIPTISFRYTNTKLVAHNSLSFSFRLSHVHSNRVKRPDKPSCACVRARMFVCVLAWYVIGKTEYCIINLSILTQFYKQPEHHFHPFWCWYWCAEKNVRIFVNFGHKFSFRAHTLCVVRFVLFCCCVTFNHL